MILVVRDTTIQKAPRAPMTPRTPRTDFMTPRTPRIDLMTPRTPRKEVLAYSLRGQYTPRNSTKVFTCRLCCSHMKYDVEK
jgi:hypothetical protein